MFEDGQSAARGEPGAAAALTTVDLASIVAALGRPDTSADDAQRVERIRLLEELKAATAAAQAETTAVFADSQEAEQREAGVKAADVGTGVAAQVGLAKRESPARARRYVGWARILTKELPHTLAALRAGEITEWRAMLVARETGWLSAEDRARVDSELAGRLGDWGDRRVEAETRRAAYRLDPHGAADRARKTEADRRVSLRPAPDTMSVLTGLLPVKQGVATFASLQQAADSARAAGDTRSRGQVMADTLVERVTGQAAAPEVPTEVELVVTDTTLFGPAPGQDGHQHCGDDYGDGDGDGDDDVDEGEHDDSGCGDGCEEPAWVPGFGPLPAPAARQWLRETDETTGVWLRRLYTRPGSGDLVAMDSRRRCFEHGLRQFVILRDDLCRTPWCGARIRHADHSVPDADGGPTSAANGQGLCEACNQAKTAPGWRASPAPDRAGHTVIMTTPTGYTYTSRAPDPPGAAPPDAASPGPEQPDTAPPDTAPPDASPPNTAPPDASPPNTAPPDASPPGISLSGTDPPMYRMHRASWSELETPSQVEQLLRDLVRAA